jgi:hypothetical protein
MSYRCHLVASCSTNKRSVMSWSKDRPVPREHDKTIGRYQGNMTKRSAGTRGTWQNDRPVPGKHDKTIGQYQGNMTEQSAGTRGTWQNDRPVPGEHDKTIGRYQGNMTERSAGTRGTWQNDRPVPGEHDKTIGRYQGNMTKRRGMQPDVACWLSVSSVTRLILQAATSATWISHKANLKFRPADFKSSRRRH